MERKREESKSGSGQGSESDLKESEKGGRGRGVARMKRRNTAPGPNRWPEFKHMKWLFEYAEERDIFIFVD
jgi:hypothetical protein